LRWKDGTVCVLAPPSRLPFVFGCRRLQLFELKLHLLQ
jgi:hypothetical protein